MDIWATVLFFAGFLIAWLIVQLIFEILKAKIQERSIQRKLDHARAALLKTVSGVIREAKEIKKNV